MKYLLASSFLCGALSVFAAPQVLDSVTVVAGNGTVEVTYGLSGSAAVVTVDFTTNGVSIGEQNFANVSGDVNKLVQPGPNKRITWKGRKSWPKNRITDGSMRAVVTAWPMNCPPDYLVVDTSEPYSAHYYVSTNAFPLGGLANRVAYCEDAIVFRKVPAGGKTWRMGCTKAQADIEGSSSSARELYRTNAIAHIVQLSYDYYFSIYPLTQGQYVKVTGKTNPSYYQGKFVDYETTPTCYGRPEERPLERISYNKLRGEGWPEGGHTVADDSTMDILRQKLGFEVDLPTETEWEFAARGGTSTLFYFGNTAPDGRTVLDYGFFGYVKPYADYYPIVTNEVGEVTTNSNYCATHPVGLKIPNSYGIYDVYGNINEWCLDWQDESAGYEKRNYQGTNRMDPVGPVKGSLTRRVTRGGYFNNGCNDANSSRRIANNPATDSTSCGVRLVCPASAVK